MRRASAEIAMRIAVVASPSDHDRNTRVTRVVAVFVALAAMTLTLCSQARAVPILSVIPTTTTTEAGGHPDISVTAEFIDRPGVGDFGPHACYCHTPREITVDTPPGIVGVPRDIPQCKAEDFALGNCPVDSQVGVAAVRINEGEDVYTFWGWMPLYNMQAEEDQLALFATPVPILKTPQYILISSRTESDYGLEFRSFGIPNLVDISAFSQIVWGTPASPAHNALRFPFGGGIESKYLLCGNINGINPIPSLLEGKAVCGGGEPFPPTPSNSPEHPFILNPTHCAGPQSLSLTVVGYELVAEHAEVPYPATTGCDRLSFGPSLSAEPTTSQADSPSGLNVDLKVPEFLSPTTPSPSEIRDAILTLPKGMTVNSNAADGKLACTDAQAKFGTREQAECPDYSKIGTFSIESTSFPTALPGAIYLGQPLPGNRYRVFLVADGFSLHVKLAGRAELDPTTGQVTVRFNDLPQAPFQDFTFHVFGAEHGLLATPTQCGTYPVKAEFVPWAAELPNQTSTQFFNIDSGPGGTECPPPARPFAPRTAAGVTDSTAGAHSSFVFDLMRNDGDQFLTSADVSTPPGFTGSLVGIPYCPESALATAGQEGASGLAEQTGPSCPAASQVGISDAVVGAGSRPATLPGRVYLAGPYRGAPLSLAVVTPAVSGPYDLGNVVVRVALDVDPVDAHITAVSDRLPQAVAGIPLRLREIQIELDREHFVLNPTNCSPFSVRAQVFGDQGAVSESLSHFQVTNCGGLQFAPTLDIKLRGSGNRNSHPSLEAVLHARPGDANISRAAVTLPPSTLLDQGHIRTVCTPAQFAGGSCPADSVYGRATAVSPLLAHPLEGPVYLRSSTHRLPDLVADLGGQVDLTLDARVDSVRGGLRTTFSTVPDVPVSTFVLRMQGGRKGLIVNSANLCAHPARALSVMDGQNGRSFRSRPKLQVRCGKTRRPERHQASVHSAGRAIR